MTDTADVPGLHHADTPLDCYVYYRVAAAQAPAARAAVARLFADIAAAYGVHGALQWRADDPARDSGGSATWMERYDGVDAAFVARLPGHVVAAGLDTLTDGARHVECFLNAPPQPSATS